MASTGYDEQYRAARHQAFDQQVKEAKANVTALEAKRDQYAPAKKTTTKKSDD